ncbi:TetR/AcrR family transcriptional regulator [Lacinutrix sp. 5H-3-7-4]|uniref:TetR/AcrR family transcriptional regulator n=1 Tax=Lacinutrix sp. (strain 5H-3-7-4) TaxID=983544 RepID=UPI00020A3A8B|nr:TetR/AcrR family transcriptional regulator [Lacinutrix sp. 5H-3-7-4]AEH02065.1 transcriptional regulator, TetR family [Lacinutrix sp. 5H-3-7-4]
MNKKEAILSAAITLLTEKGVHNTPMSAIAKAAGTGMGTIYNYYSNKDALINAIYINIKQEETKVFTAFDATKPIKTQFENYYAAIIDFFITHPTYFQFMEQLQASPIITESSRNEGQKSITEVYNLLKKGQQQRIIKSINIDELLMFIGGSILSYLRWHFNQKETKTTTLNNQINLLWDAIKA